MKIAGNDRENRKVFISCDWLNEIFRKDVVYDNLKSH